MPKRKAAEALPASIAQEPASTSGTGPFVVYFPSRFDPKGGVACEWQTYAHSERKNQYMVVAKTVGGRRWQRMRARTPVPSCMHARRQPPPPPTTPSWCSHLCCIACRRARSTLLAAPPIPSTAARCPAGARRRCPRACHRRCCLPAMKLLPLCMPVASPAVKVRQLPDPNGSAARKPAARAKQSISTG